jgi:hypothetical protein
MVHDVPLAVNTLVDTGNFPPESVTVQQIGEGELNAVIVAACRADIVVPPAEKFPVSVTTVVRVTTLRDCNAVHVWHFLSSVSSRLAKVNSWIVWVSVALTTALGCGSPSSPHTS